MSASVTTTSGSSMLSIANSERDHCELAGVELLTDGRFAALRVMLQL